MPDDGHRTFWGQWPEAPWKAPREDNMPFVDEEFADEIDDDELLEGATLLSWEELEEKEMDEFLKGDDEDE
jgi:hypothetical protein